MVVTTPTVVCDSTHFLWHHLATPLHLGCAGNSSDNTIAHNAMLMLHAMLPVASLKATHDPFSIETPSTCTRVVLSTVHSGRLTNGMQTPGHDIPLTLTYPHTTQVADVHSSDHSCNKAIYHSGLMATQPLYLGHASSSA